MKIAIMFMKYNTRKIDYIYIKIEKLFIELNFSCCKVNITSMMKITEINQNMKCQIYSEHLLVNIQHIIPLEFSEKMLKQNT